MLNLDLHAQWDLDQFTVVLVFNNDHNIYCHMVAKWSVGSTWTYFSHPDSVNLIGPYLYYYVMFFPGRVGYTHLGTHCDLIIAIIDFSNAAVSFVITAFLAL